MTSEEHLKMLTDPFTPCANVKMPFAKWALCLIFSITE